MTSSFSISPVLLEGVRARLGDPQARIVSVERQLLSGGLSGSRLEYWRMGLKHANALTPLTLVYKNGSAVTGALMRGAAQREALAYANLTDHTPLTVPNVVAADTFTGDIWMLPLPPAKPATHWSADWTEDDVRCAITDLVRFHAAFLGKEAIARQWRWLLRPTMDDAERLLADGREGLELVARTASYDDVLTANRVARLLSLSYHPERLLHVLDECPNTLLHGDAGFQNIAVVPTARKCIWYDWQLVGWGPFVLDLVTFLHPWGYLESRPPLSIRAIIDYYLKMLQLKGIEIAPAAFHRQLDAAFLWRWLIQWGPLLGKYRERLRPDIYERLGRAFEQWVWPIIDRELF